MGFFDRLNQEKQPQDKQTGAYSDFYNEQIRQTQAEYERKRKNLYQQHLDIVHASGAQAWHPNRGQE